MVGNFTAALLNKQEELERYLRPSSSIREGIEVTNQADELDNITARQQRELSLDDLRRASATLSRVKAALQRVSLGSFGICLTCEEEIPEKRLRAIPWSERCIPCQESAEILAAEEGRLHHANESNDAL